MFMWGLADAFLRALGFPRESFALRQEWLPPRERREPVERAAALYAVVQSKPLWLRNSRIGQRLLRALAYLEENGAADEFADHLRYLADQDEDKTHNNYGLIRFICWLMPVLGFLGTVLHFGGALGGISMDKLNEELPLIVGEMGTAFNTTTVALTGAVTMMLLLFLCERTEREIIRSVDRRTERELLNRFEVSGASIQPFLQALHSANSTTLRAIESTMDRQLQIWETAFESVERQTEERERAHADRWEDTWRRIEQQLLAVDAEREARLLQVMDHFLAQSSEHQARTHETTERMAALDANCERLVEQLADILKSDDELVRLQSTLVDNLRVLHETHQIDQAVHELSAAIHLLTARHRSDLRPDRPHMTIAGAGSKADSSGLGAKRA
jgi:biopolymer transport protein ExbB/TolQ